MSKRRGVTLIELVVALSCTTIFLGSIITSFYFINKLNKEMIAESSDLYKISVIRDYIIENKIENKDPIIINDNGEVKCGDKTLCFVSSIKEIVNMPSDNGEGYSYWVISYGNNEEYKFIVK